MESFELSTVTNRPAGEVFGFLANLENDLQRRSDWVETRKLTVPGEAQVHESNRRKTLLK